VADEPQIVVPRVHWDYTTARVMAMDYMDGVPLESLVDDAPQKARDAVGSLLAEADVPRTLRVPGHADRSNFANYCTSRTQGDSCCSTSARRRSSPRSSRSGSAASPVRSSMGDRHGIEEGARSIGYISDDASGDVVQAALDVLELVCEPLRTKGPYDYSGSDLPKRARELGIEPGVQARLATHAALGHDVPAPQAGRRVPAAGTARRARGDRTHPPAVSRARRGVEISLIRSSGRSPRLPPTVHAGAGGGGGWR